MLLCQSLAGMALALPTRVRSLYQRRTRRPLPVVPERRMNIPEVPSKPPRILAKSFLAIQRLESEFTQKAPPEQKDDFLSKWKYLKSS